MCEGHGINASWEEMDMYLAKIYEETERHFQESVQLCEDYEAFEVEMQDHEERWYLVRDHLQKSTSCGKRQKLFFI